MDKAEAGSQRRRGLYWKILRETGTTYVGTIIGMVIGYVNVMLITRWLSPDEYGLYSLGLTIIGPISILATLSLNDALVRFIPFYQATERSGSLRSLLTFAFAVSLCTGLVGAVILQGAAHFISVDIFHKSRLEDVLRILGLAVPWLVFILMVGYAFMGWKEMRYMVYMQRLWQPLGQLLMILAFSFLGYRLNGLLTAYLIAVVSSGFLAFYLFWRKLIPRAPPGDRKVEKGEIIQYAYPLLGNRIIVFLLNGCIDVLLLGYFLPAGEIGQYKIAQLSVQPLGVVMFSFALIGKPVMSELIAREQWGDVKKVYQRISKWVVCLNLPLFVLLAFAGEDILVLFFTRQFSGGSTALILLSLGLILNSLCGPEGKGLDAAGHTRWLFFNAAASLSLNFILGWILIPRIGIEGAAIAVSAGLVFQGLLGVTQLGIRYGIHPLSRHLVRVLLAGVFLLAAGYLCGPLFANHPLRLLLFAVLIFPVWFLLLMAFRGLDNTDKEMLSGLRKKIGQ